MTICHQICFFEFVTENKDIFLLDDHIWKCQNLKGRTDSGYAGDC